MQRLPTSSSSPSLGKESLGSLLYARKETAGSWGHACHCGPRFSSRPGRRDAAGGAFLMLASRSRVVCGTHASQEQRLTKKIPPRSMYTSSKRNETLLPCHSTSGNPCNKRPLQSTPRGKNVHSKPEVGHSVDEAPQGRRPDRREHTRKQSTSFVGSVRRRRRPRVTRLATRSDVRTLSVLNCLARDDNAQTRLHERGSTMPPTSPAD